VGGTVADANDDGFGDNHNESLASGAPVLISAGVGQSGGPGSNGTVRIEIEWDISALGPPGPNDTAQVQLTTNRGTVDSLLTFFFTGAGGNGTLEDSDFEANLAQLAGISMPVVGSVGADGTFTFDVKDALAAAIAGGATFFTVQGRVDESQTSGRGMQIYSTANNTLNAGKEPALIITTPPPTPPTTFTVLSLPSDGTLADSAQNTITTVPYTLPDNQVTYTPVTGFQGSTSFSYRAELSTQVDTGIVTIFVNFLDCAVTPAGCDDGR
jgi:hypothetical protein